MSADEEEDEAFAGVGAVAVPTGPPQDAGDGATLAPSYDDESGGKVIEFSTARGRAEAVMRAARRRNLIILGLLVVALAVLIGWRRSDGNAA